MTEVQYTENYYTSADDLQLYYRDYNHVSPDAPTVLCMPGLTRNTKDFNDIAAHMAKTCRVICVDQRGRGKSEWDPKPANYTPPVYIQDMMILLDLLQPTKLVAFGTSLGGLMTMMMAAMKPGIFIGAILNDIGPEIDPKGIERIVSYVGKGTPPETWAEAVEAVKGANTGIYPTFNEDDWLAFTQKLYRDDMGKPVLQYDPALGATFENSNNAPQPDMWPLFDALSSTPTVVLRGGLSDILSAATLEKMASRHPNCTPVTVADKGHVPLMTEPECLNAIDTLLKKLR